MPLIIITGYPCCGKTTFSKALMSRLQSLTDINATDSTNEQYSSDAKDSDTNKHSDSEINDVSVEKLTISNRSARSGKAKSHDHSKSLSPDNLLPVILINEESENIRKSEAYMFSSQEKNTRGVIKSAVNHKLSSNIIVICDSLNYIKGFRYELHCITKTFRTPHCIVWVEADDNVAMQWNAARPLEDRYEEATLLDLRRRFEAPNENNRWDSPLFRVNMTPTDQPNPSPHPEEESSKAVMQTSSSTIKKSAWKPKAKKVEKNLDQPAETALNTVTEETFSTSTLSFSGSYVKLNASNITDTMDEVIEKIIKYLQRADEPVPNASTMPIYHGTADILYELDKTSKEIMDTIINHQNVSSEGTPIIFHEYNRSFALHRRVGATELQRHRRQFLKVNSTHPPETSKAIGEAFIDFLSLQI